LWTEITSTEYEREGHATQAIVTDAEWALIDSAASYNPPRARALGGLDRLTVDDPAEWAWFTARRLRALVPANAKK